MTRRFYRIMTNTYDLPLTDERLNVAASFVRSGSVVCDVGTDHAYLPIRLLLTEVCPRAVVSDVHEAPLAKARENAAHFGCTSRMTFCLADGLSGIDLAGEGVRDILICGMGGELIARILDDAPYTRQNGVKCILQPMSKAADLREYLARRGYRIEDERLAGAGGKIYTCLHVAYDGIIRDFAPVEYLLGVAHIQRGCHGSPLFAEYLLREIRSVEKRQKGLLAGELPSDFEDALLSELYTVAEREGVAL